MNNNAKSDPLNKLFKDNKNIQEKEREELAMLLEPYVVIGNDSSTRIINFKPKFYKLTNTHRIVIIFLAEKARALYLQNSEEGIGQSEIIALKAMPEGSVKSSLSKLSKKGLLIQNKKGKYIVPNYNLQDIFQNILNEDSK